ncbi:MAG: formylglycine-generating enzyme family protein [Leptolyngbyaceae cyanobacterium]
MLDGDSVAASADTLTLHRYECSNESYTLDLGGGVDLTLMLIPAGQFMMGAADDDPDASDSERPQHRVRLSQFLLGMTPVTQAQWRVVAGYDLVDIDLKAEPSRFKGADLPVERVSWQKATEFCNRLSQKTGKSFHLPSEAQWEYACRAGTETAYHFGPQITTELANYGGEIGQTTVIKRYPPNRWGLYDMHGNVWEWCQDVWHDNYVDAPTDGSAWLEGGNSAYHVRRGGAWSGYPRGCRSAYRSYINPGYRYNDIGFRVCCAAPRTL